VQFSSTPVGVVEVIKGRNESEGSQRKRWSNLPRSIDVERHGEFGIM